MGKFKLAKDLLGMIGEELKTISFGEFRAASEIGRMITVAVEAFNFIILSFF